MEKREVIFEIRRIGDYAQVRAIDVATHLEIAANAPASTPENALKQLAINKLKYALQKNGYL